MKVTVLGIKRTLDWGINAQAHNLRILKKGKNTYAYKKHT